MFKKQNGQNEPDKMQQDKIEPNRSQLSVQSAQANWGEDFLPLCIIPQRIMLAIFGFFAIVNAYTMRICISMVITQLVVERNVTMNDAKKGKYCPRDLARKKPIKGGTYDWSQSLQGWILSAFYVGYVTTHIPGGILADKFGGKYVLMLGILSTALFTLTTPVCIEVGGAVALIVLRVLMGIGEGTTFPALSVLLAHWAPENERAKLGAFVLGGGQIGSLICNSVSGVMLDQLPWPWVFYIFGALALLWCLLFTLLCYSDPTKHPCIKQSEKDYLIQEMGSIGRNKKKLPTPWKMIFTNIPMAALVCAQIGHDWGLFIMVTYLPKYMADVMQFSIKSNGFYSSLPYLAMWIVSIVAGFIADWLIKKHYLSITNVRKVFTAVAAICPGFFMVCASYAGCNKILVVVLFTFSMASMGPYYSGMKLNPLDMSPNYAGVLMAITNGIASTMGFIVPVSVGYMTPDATMEQWRLVFWVAFIILTVTAIVYVIWASAEIQPFNDPPPKTK